MRWIQHWIIGADCLRARQSLPYQLGCLLPDWFGRHPIHRTEESMEDFLDRAVRVRGMAPGWKKDWEMGWLAHFLCDYCTEAHNEEYYHLYRHRVHEVLAQKRIKALCRKNPQMLTKIRPLPVPAILTDPRTGDEEFRRELEAYLTKHLGVLHGKIQALDSPRWYTDRRVMDLDILWAHRLLGAFLEILGEKNREEEG